MNSNSFRIIELFGIGKDETEMGNPEELVVDAIKRHIKKLKKEHPIWLFRTHSSGRQRRGIPDLHITFWGVSVWLEVKAPGGEATPLQRQRIREINNAGGFATVVESLDEFNAALRRVLASYGGSRFCPACKKIVQPWQVAVMEQALCVNCGVRWGVDELKKLPPQLLPRPVE